MQPNQNQYPIDYLNQISPEVKKPAMQNRILYIVISAAVLLTLVIAVFALLGSGSGSSKSLSTLAARLQTLQSIASTSQQTIKSSQLRTINSSLSLFLTNTNRDILEPLTANKIKSTALDKTVLAKENGAELKKTLEDARLNAVFDRTYAREMSYELDTVAALMKELYTDTKSQSLKAFLETTDTNLQPIKKQFSDFNAANN